MIPVLYRVLAPWSPFFLPVIFPAIGYCVASILKQVHWSANEKDTLAWFVLVMSALADAITSGAWSQDPTLLLPVLSAIGTLLIAGAYGQLAPWLVGMAWIEKTFFNLPLTPSRVPTTVQALEQGAAQSPLILPAVVAAQPTETPTIDQQTTGPAPIIPPVLTLPVKDPTTTIRYPEHL